MDKARSLRPRRADDLGLRQAMSDRVLTVLVAAMSFLAALALAGAVAADSLARHWYYADGATLAIMVPEPEAAYAGLSRADAVLAALRATAGLADVHRRSDSELHDMLRPWADVNDLPLPGLFVARVAGALDQNELQARLARVAPGAMLERAGDWLARLKSLMLSVRAYALLALLLVLCIATAIVGLATHAGLAARRETIYIVHGLGATDGFIAYRFAGRTGMQALLGGAAGALLAVPVLLTLAELAAPFTRAATAPGPVAAPTAAAFVQALPAPLWVAVAGLPVAAWLIGWVTVQVSVRLWLARLP